MHNPYASLPLTPIRPIAVTPRRHFSVDPKENTSRGRFFDFLKNTLTKTEDT